ncbi:MXAN_6640 family putative metalloprotease [Polyangium aurulentum]|uniref:MXAN_6640 family putative metalloprotease n=1 Tax=Polyangium aurulentum TaxID=2567896 RepID=UPI0010ADF6EA|nr:MXAN_6640 family putative metalloprotease [Polyangium aurulentum]UQA56769.1 hypothetical protein E8A73_036530 [Polyangium aurulentum]
MKERVRLFAFGLAAVLLAGCGPEDVPSAIEAPGLAPEVRPDTPNSGLQFTFAPDDVVETFGSSKGAFLVHFTRKGPNAVPAGDADGSGVPDFVEEVAAVYDEVLAYYRDVLGFRAPLDDEGLPDNGGDGRFDVYLVDFAGIGDGKLEADTCEGAGGDQCVAYMVQENDYLGYNYPSTLVANRILGSHEFFHAIQAAYDSSQGSVFGEGTAVWATESFDPSLKDFENFIDGYLDNADRSLDVPLPGPVDPFSYGSALFFQFLEERHGEGTVRTLVERTENGVKGVPDPVWFEQLDPTLQAVAGTSFAEAFVEFATWNLFTGKHADPARSYAGGAGYPPVGMEHVAAPYTYRLRAFYSASQYYEVAPEGRAQMTAALVTPPDAPGDLEDLTLLVAVERGGVYDPLVRIDDIAAGVDAVDTASADRMVVVVVNTAQGGSSRRPTLCIGSPEEVAACKAEIVPPTGGEGGSEPGGYLEPHMGCGGCALAPAPAESAFGALGAALVLAYRRRARRAPTSPRAKT